VRVRVPPPALKLKGFLRVDEGNRDPSIHLTATGSGSTRFRQTKLFKIVR